MVMWLLNYLVCIIRKHLFAAITIRNLSYHYCLRCGKFEVENQNN